MFLPPPQAPQDLFRRIQCFEQLPEYESYLKGFASLPAPPESGWDLSWPFPSPPVLDFDRALPGYVGPYLQSLTPLGGGGVRRSAPWPPPCREKPLEVGVPTESRSSTSGPACQAYPEIPEPQADPEAAARILASRLVGDPARRSALCSVQENHDILHLERLTVYSVLREDAGLRYSVDKRRFFRTLASGAICDLLSLARASQMLRLGPGRLKQWLGLLPHERHLFTPPPPRPPKRAVPVVAPPAPTPAPAASSVSPPVAAPAAPAAPKPVVTLEAASFAQPKAEPVVEAPPAEPMPIPPEPEVPTAPFHVKIHRYWDVAAGDYCEVAEVLLEGKGCDEDPLLNTEKVPAFLVQKNLPLGAAVRVTVTWANGVKRTWEERLTQLASGIETEVFSPDG